MTFAANRRKSAEMSAKKSYRLAASVRLSVIWLAMKRVWQKMAALVCLVNNREENKREEMKIWRQTRRKLQP